MKTEANCTFTVAGWDEDTYKDLKSGGKLTKATVSQNYEGDLSGHGEIEFLMSHETDEAAHFVGLELVTGTLSGKAGCFIIQHVGIYGAGGAHSDWTILPGSGTDELEGLRGEGSYTATAKTVEMSFSYDLNP